MNGYLAVMGKLIADGQLGLLVGGSGVGNARIFPGDFPQESDFPQIRVDTFDTDPYDSKSGVAATERDIVKVFGCAEKDAQAFLMSDRIRDCLDGASGVVNGIDMQYCRYLRSDTYDIEVTNRGTTKHQRIRVHEHDYEVRINR